MIANNHTNGYRDPDTFDVAAALRSISEAARHHKMLVLFTCVLTLGLATWYVYAWPPIYRAEAMVASEPWTDPARDAFYVNWNVFRKDDARTEIELMTSGLVLKEVIEKEKLSYDDVYHPFLSQVAYFWEKSWIGRNYRAMKKKLFRDEEDDKEAPSPALVELGKTIVDMREGISIIPVGDTNVGRVRVKGPSRRVANIANTMLDVYLERRKERYHTEAQRSFDILTEEAARAEKNLKEIASRRLAFVQQHTLAFDFQKETQDLKQLTDLEGTIATSRTRIATLDASLREVEKELEREPPTRTLSTAITLNAVRETAKLKRLELQTALIGARDRYREDSPEVREIVGNLSKLDALIADAPEKVEQGTNEGLNAVRQQLITSRNSLRAELEGTRAGLQVLEETTTKMRARLAGVPAAQNTLNELDRETLLAREKHQALMLKRAQADVSLATVKSTTPSLRVVEYAVPPGSRWWPRNKIVFPVALLLGLLLGVVAAQIKSLLSGRVRRAHVERGRGIAPLYATIGVATQGRPLAVVPPPKTATMSSSGAELT